MQMQMQIGNVKVRKVMGVNEYSPSVIAQRAKRPTPAMAKGASVQKRIKRTRWTTELFDRYGNGLKSAYPADREGNAPQLIHMLYREPPGFHQGARVRFSFFSNDASRRLVRKDRNKLRTQLESLKGGSGR